MKQPLGDVNPPATRYANLRQRVISATIGAAILVSSIWLRDWTFALVFSLISVLSQWEFYRLLHLDKNRPLIAYCCAVGFMICVMAFLIERTNNQGQFQYASYYWICPAALVIFLIQLYGKSDPAPFISIALAFMGILYVAVPFALLIVIGLWDGVYHPWYIFGFLMLLWAFDTGAYFVGGRFGRTPLFKRISPKKTWEGTFGGTTLSLLVAFVLGLNAQHTTLTISQWLGIWAIIVVMASYGDLIESLLKRNVGAKDSGQSIPGHGGFLDRFDGLLLAAPFLVTFLKLFV
jgi:phosphatidate cytidylyltransferase